MPLTGQNKSSATTMSIPTKNAVTMSGMTRVGSAWAYNDPAINYDSVLDIYNREVFYESVGQSTVMTPQTKNNA